MPDAISIIHPLPSATNEPTNSSFIKLPSRRDDNKIRPIVKRQKRLTPQRMPLEHRHFKRQDPRLPAKQIHKRPPTLVFHINPCKIVETNRRPEINRDLLRPLKLDDIA